MENYLFDQLEDLRTQNKMNSILVICKKINDSEKLIEQFTKDKKTLFYSLSSNPKEFFLKASTNDISLENIDIYSKDDWLDLSKYLFSCKEKITVVFEGITEIALKIKNFISNLYAFWELQNFNSNLLLINITEPLSKIENIPDSSLLISLNEYVYKMQEMSFAECFEMFTNFSYHELIYLYSLFNGTTSYMNEFNTQYNLIENLKLNLLKDDSKLHKEIKTVLEDEVNFKILKIIYDQDILDYHKYQKSINKLCDYDIIQKRNNLYEFKDNLYLFYFKYINPNKDKSIEFMISKVKEDYCNFIYKTYKKIVYEFSHENFEEMSDLKPIYEKDGVYLFSLKKSRQEIWSILFCHFKETTVDDLKSYLPKKTNIEFFVHSLLGFSHDLKEFAASSKNIILVENK